jgi:hypothetical protein
MILVGGGLLGGGVRPVVLAVILWTKGAVFKKYLPRKYDKLNDPAGTKYVVPSAL